MASSVRTVRSVDALAFINAQLPRERRYEKDHGIRLQKLLFLTELSFFAAHKHCAFDETAVILPNGPCYEAAMRYNTAMVSEGQPAPTNDGTMLPANFTAEAKKICALLGNLSPPDVVELVHSMGIFAAASIRNSSAKFQFSQEFYESNEHLVQKALADIGLSENKRDEDSEPPAAKRPRMDNLRADSGITLGSALASSTSLVATAPFLEPIPVPSITLEEFAMLVSKRLPMSSIRPNQAAGISIVVGSDRDASYLQRIADRVVREYESEAPAIEIVTAAHVCTWGEVLDSMLAANPTDAVRILLEVMHFTFPWCTVGQVYGDAAGTGLRSMVFIPDDHVDAADARDFCTMLLSVLSVIPTQLTYLSGMDAQWYCGLPKQGAALECNIAPAKPPTPLAALGRPLLSCRGAGAAALSPMHRLLYSGAGRMRCESDGLSVAAESCDESFEHVLTTQSTSSVGVVGKTETAALYVLSAGHMKGDGTATCDTDGMLEGDGTCLLSYVAHSEHSNVPPVPTAKSSAARARTHTLYVESLYLPYGPSQCIADVSVYRMDDVGPSKTVAVSAIELAEPPAERHRIVSLALPPFPAEHMWGAGVSVEGRARAVFECRKQVDGRVVHTSTELVPEGLRRYEACGWLRRPADALGTHSECLYLSKPLEGCLTFIAGHSGTPVFTAEGKLHSFVTGNVTMREQTSAVNIGQRNPCLGRYCVLTPAALALAQAQALLFAKDADPHPQTLQAVAKAADITI
jgi:hypothetical protein